MTCECIMAWELGIIIFLAICGIAIKLAQLAEDGYSLEKK